MSGLRKGNEFKQCVDLYEYLFYVEEHHWQAKVNIEEDQGKKGELSPLALAVAVALCFGFGSVICSLFDSLHHPFHFILLWFRFISVHALISEPLVLVPFPTAQH